MDDHSDFFYPKPHSKGMDRRVQVQFGRRMSNGLDDDLPIEIIVKDAPSFINVVQIEISARQLVDVLSGAIAHCPARFGNLERVGRKHEVEIVHVPKGIVGSLYDRKDMTLACAVWAEENLALDEWDEWTVTFHNDGQRIRLDRWTEEVHYGDSGE